MSSDRILNYNNSLLRYVPHEIVHTFLTIVFSIFIEMKQSGTINWNNNTYLNVKGRPLIVEPIMLLNKCIIL